MQTVLIVIHLLIVLALVVVVLLQRSEGGALGMGGGGGGGLMTARGAANVLTRTTAILATLFFITSMALGILARYGGDNPLDILDRIPAQQDGSAPAGASGNLLDQLGPLPDEAAPASGTPQVPTGTGAGVGATTGAAPATLATPVTPTAPSGVPTGAATQPVQQIPANPAPQAPNAAETPTVPPVEAPAPGSQPSTGTSP